MDGPLQSEQTQRILHLSGVLNLRDVGGYPTRDGRRTRWRTLLRSACLDTLDLDGQRWLLNAGLRTIVDVRDPREIAEHPNVFAASSALTYIHLPFWEGPPPDGLVIDLRRGYRREMDLLGERMVRLVETIAARGATPALIHCAAGKDRTGIAVAILLASVGVEPATIAEDYALSEHCLGPDYLARTQAWVLSLGYDWETWEHTIHTPPERMLLTLEYLEEQWGGVRGYLLQHGLTERSLDDLRAVLTEESA